MKNFKYEGWCLMSKPSSWPPLSDKEYYREILFHEKPLALYIISYMQIF